MLKKRITVGLIAAALFASILHGSTQAAGSAEEAFRNGRSGVMVTVEGAVIRLLADDNDGSRHQRFIIRLASGQTLLIAHNIDLSSRVPAQQNVQVKLHGATRVAPFTGRTGIRSRSTRPAGSKSADAGTTNEVCRKSRKKRYEFRLFCEIFTRHLGIAIVFIKSTMARSVHCLHA